METLFAQAVEAGRMTTEQTGWRAILVLHVSNLMPLYDEMKATKDAGAITRTEYLEGLCGLLEKAHEVMDDQAYATLARYWNEVEA